MYLIVKVSQFRAARLGSDKELALYIETDNLNIFADGVSLAIGDDWRIYKGRFPNKEEIGTEFVIREFKSHKVGKKHPFGGQCRFLRRIRRITPKVRKDNTTDIAKARKKLRAKLHPAVLKGTKP